MTQRSITYLKGISETGDIADQTLFEDMIDSMHPELPALGTFNPAMTFNVKGQYSDYTPTSSTTVTFTASSIVDGLTQWVKIITDGTVTFAAGSGCELLSGSLGLLQAGTYKFGFGSIFGAVQIIVPGTEQSTQLSTPVLTASSQDSAIRIVFSSEDLASTGRELYRSTVNDVQTASSVAGFDGTADYVDNNNGAGLTNGTTYYYWGRNTAPGYTNSAYATDSAAPSASVTQLTQPTGLTATGGNNTVALTYDAIDVNADDVAVQRSLTSGSGFATIATISRALTSYDDNTAVNGTTYYYRLIANGSGSYSNSNPSAEASATPAQTILLEDDFDTAYTETSPGAGITFTPSATSLLVEFAGVDIQSVNNNYRRTTSGYNAAELYFKVNLSSTGTYVGIARGFKIFIDANNYVQVLNDSVSGDSTLQIHEKFGGSLTVNDYSTPSSFIQAYKVKATSTEISVYYRNGASWALIETFARSWGVGDKYFEFGSGDFTPGSGSITFNESYITDYDFTTLNP